MESCPTGFLGNKQTNHCEEISSKYKAVSFDFTKSAPWISTGRDKTVKGDWCNPPVPIQNRGLYFDGTTTIKVENFYFNSSFTFGFWAHPK
jgi:hypothetical protein